MFEFIRKIHNDKIYKKIAIINDKIDELDKDFYELNQGRICKIRLRNKDITRLTLLLADVHNDPLYGKYKMLNYKAGALYCLLKFRYEEYRGKLIKELSRLQNKIWT